VAVNTINWSFYLVSEHITVDDYLLLQMRLGITLCYFESVC